MRTTTKDFKICSVSLRPEVFIKLKIYSAKHRVPYSVILEALADNFIEDPNSFINVNFDKYRRV